METRADATAVRHRTTTLAAQPIGAHERGMAKKAKPRSDLNPEQEAVASHVDGPLRVVATAGSGKTTALIERAVRLVQSGVDMQKILLISFSVNARKQMAQRISARLPGTEAGEMCRTFHSIALDIFRREVDPQKSWALDTSGSLTRMVIRSALNDHGLSPTHELSQAVFDFASRAKNDLLVEPPALRRLGLRNPGLLRLASTFANDTLVGCSGDDLVTVLLAMEDNRRRGLRLDGAVRRFANFDDLLVHAAHLLIQNDVRERWGLRWSHVMQDEAQDENTAQAEIAHALCRTSRNYVIVGDPAQSIFGFRGSRPQRILKFDEEWPGAATVKMFRNYRSGIEIVEASNRLISLMPPDTVLPMEAKSERQTHAFLAAAEFRTQNDEAKAIAANIKAHRRDGVDWKDQAILVRTNAQTGPIEAALAEAEIPYNLISGESFFELRETGFFFGSMRMIEKRAKRDDVRMAMSVVANKAFADGVAARYEEDPEHDWFRAVQGELESPNANLAAGTRRRLQQWIGTLLRPTSNGGTVVSPYKIVKLLQWAVLPDEKATASDTKKLEAAGDNLKSENVKAVCSFVSDYASCAAVCDKLDLIDKARSSRTPNKVAISTVHKAKGAEWPIVYIAGCENGLFPVGSADLVEERRLFYVAVTRAMDELWVSYSTEDDERDKEPSCFIEEAKIPITNWPETGRRITPARVGDQLSLI